MPPKYVFNHIAITDGFSWMLFHKLDKKIPKNVDCYPNTPIAEADDLDTLYELARMKNIYEWDIQVIENR